MPLEPGFPSADWVRWLHNGRRLLKGRKGSFVLAVDRATAADAGNYTCIPHSSQVSEVPFMTSALRGEGDWTLSRR